MALRQIEQALLGFISYGGPLEGVDRLEHKRWVRYIWELAYADFLSDPYDLAAQGCELDRPLDCTIPVDELPEWDSGLMFLTEPRPNFNPERWEVEAPEDRTIPLISGFDFGL